jgi:hypothetical protein
MYRNVPKRRLGQDESGLPISDNFGFPDIGSAVSTPVSISPLMLGGIGLLALAYVLSGARRAGAAVSRKGKAVRKALRA